MTIDRFHSLFSRRFSPRTLLKGAGTFSIATSRVSAD
jgi:hypothetical protein